MLQRSFCLVHPSFSNQIDYSILDDLKSFLKMRGYSFEIAGSEFIESCDGGYYYDSEDDDQQKEKELKDEDEIITI